MKCLAPNIMHDLLEGVIPLTTGLVLHMLVMKKYIKLEEINFKICNFNYGATSKGNRPPEIPKRIL